MVRTCICITVFLLFLFIFRGTCATLQVLMCPKKNSTARQLKAQPAAGAPVAVIRQQPTPPQEAQPTTSPASATRPAVRHSRHPPPQFLHENLRFCTAGSFLGRPNSRAARSPAATPLPPRSSWLARYPLYIFIATAPFNDFRFVSHPCLAANAIQ